MKRSEKIGILGGTFDPIHLGHLLIAEAARDYLQLSKVIFIPAANPPHKLQKKVSSQRDRYEMTALAIENNPFFQISDIELKRQGPSYSRDTIRELQEFYGREIDLYFIVGADSLVDLPTWSRPEELLARCHLVGTSRPGSMPNLDKLRAYFGYLGEKIHCLETPEMDISSTAIRERVSQGLSIKYLVPERVEEYILIHRLYNS